MINARNFIGLTKVEEDILLLLSEGNSIEAIALVYDCHPRFIGRIIQQSRINVGAETNYELLAKLLTDLHRHGDWNGYVRGLTDHKK